MAQFCTCGAELPDNARFCHQCGKPQRDEPVVTPEQGPPAPGEPPVLSLPVTFGNPIAVRAALLSASISALLTVIPIVSLGCCLWVIGGGFVSVFIYSRRTGLVLSTGDGVRMGWITGLLTFVIGMVLTAISFAMARAAGGFREALQAALERSPARSQVPQQIIDFLTSPAGIAMFLIGYLILGFIVVVSLSIAGGALGAKVLEKE